MELRHLRYFVMAAEERNISRASARLNISQPAVSRQLKDLEEELGVHLFDRERDGLKITPAGSRALVHAKKILRDSLSMMEDMTEFQEAAKRLSLHVGFLPTALPGFLAVALRKFNEKHDNVCVQIHEASPREQEAALRKGALDLALLGDACPGLKKHFKVETIRKTPMAILLPDNHPLKDRKAIDLAELGDERFVSLHEKQFPGRLEIMKDLFGRAEISPEVVMKASGLSELLGLVAGGMGVALAPADLEQLPHAGVQFVTLKRPRLTLTFSAVWREKRETKELRSLIDLLKA